MSTTALTVITNAFNDLNVFMPGDAIPGPDSSLAFTLLNNMVGALALQGKTIPYNAREVFALVAGKGGSTTPYTLGPGGDFNTTRPASMANVTGAGIVFGNTPPPLAENRRAIINDDEYQAIAFKDLQNTLFTSVYINLTYASGFATVNLWPVPNTAIHSLALYQRKPFATFASLTASYDLPQGCDEMLQYNLELRLARPYGRSIDDDLKEQARTSLGLVKRANNVPLEVAVDQMYLSGNGRRYGYNIVTGQGG